MSEELDDQAKQPRFGKKVRLSLLGGGCIVLLAGVAFIVLGQVSHKSPPLSQAITKTLNFAVYYPTSLPAGFDLKQGSVSTQHESLFFQFQKNSDTIYVTEQSAPENPPDLKSINGFGQVSTITGQGVIGTVNNQPTGILLTKTTLITINGTKNVPTEQVGTLVQNLRSIQ